MIVHCQPPQKKPQLRDYQRKAVSLVESAFSRGCNAPLLCMPTGSGKTLTASIGFILDYPEARYLWVCHTDELRKQAAKEMRKIGITDFTVITKTPKPGQKIDARVVIISIDMLMLTDSFVNDPHYIIIDEAHLYPSPARFAAIMRFKKAKLIGLSATPGRSDMNTLDRIFDAIYHPIFVSDLIRSGDLCRITLAGAKERTRVDWKHSEDPNWAPYVSYKEHLLTKKHVLTFCHQVKHAYLWCDFLLSLGRKAAVIHGGLDKKERKKILDAFEAGELTDVVNCRVLTAGYDLPALDGMMLLSANLERTTYMQIVGRGMRPAPGKLECVVCDMTGAFKEHGDPNEDTWYSLFTGSGDLDCSQCGAKLTQKQWIISKDPACTVCAQKKRYGKHCPTCGWHWVKEEEDDEEAPDSSERKKKEYPQHIAEMVVDFIESRAPVWFSNHRGIQEQLKNPEAKEATLAWQAENFRADPINVRQASYVALHAHLDYLSVLRKRFYDPMWAEYVYNSHYGVWAPGNWKKLLKE